MDAVVKTQAKPSSAPILPNTPEMEAFLSVGYGGLNVAEAKAILKAVDPETGNPQAYPVQEIRNARAFLAAYGATPEPVATRKMWQRPVRA